MPSEERPRWQRGLLKGLLAFHVIAIISWTMPPAPDAVSLGLVPARGAHRIALQNDRWVRLSPVHEYILDLGVWQSWDMFAPNPSNRDVWGDAEIVYANGEVERWLYPRMAKLDVVTKFSKERWRKYFERVNIDNYYFLRPALCEWIARINDTKPGNPPTLVRLFRHLKLTPPTITFEEYIAQGIFKIPDNPANDGPYETEMMIEYRIEPEMLK